MNRRSDAAISEASAGAELVGGGYYDPLEEFLAVARPISSRHDQQLLSQRLELNSLARPSYVIDALYVSLRKWLTEDEILFGVYDRGTYAFAVMLYNAERLMNFEAQVQSGALVRKGFFAIHRDQAMRGVDREVSVLE